MITKSKLPTQSELIEKICPSEIKENPAQYEAFIEGFKKSLDL